MNVNDKYTAIQAALRAHPNLPLLDALSALGELDTPWWYRTWRVTAPSTFEHDKLEVLEICRSKDGRTLIATPIYSLFGRGGYLPDFVSERYMRHKTVGAFVDVLHNWMIAHWVKMHTFDSPPVRKKSYTLYGLLRHLREWYTFNYGKEIEIEIKQWQPSKHVFDGFKCSATRLGSGIGDRNRTLHGIHITVSEYSAVGPIEAEASKYCDVWAEVSVRASVPGSLGRGALEGMALQN